MATKKIILETISTPSQQIVSLFKAASEEDIPLDVGVKKPAASTPAAPAAAAAGLSQKLPQPKAPTPQKAAQTGINSPALMESRHLRRTNPTMANAFLQQTVSNMGHSLHDASLHPVGSKGHHEPVAGALAAVMQLRREVPKEHYEAFAKQFQQTHPNHPLASALGASDAAVEQRRQQHVDAARNFGAMSEAEQQAHTTKGAELVKRLQDHHAGSKDQGGLIPLPPGAKNHKEAAQVYGEKLKTFLEAAQPKSKPAPKESSGKAEPATADKSGDKPAKPQPFWAQRLQQTKPKMHKRGADEDEWEKSFSFNGVNFQRPGGVVLEKSRKR